MNLETYGWIILFLVMGYLIGSISFSIIITKILKLGDVRKKGSGNAGATNTLRNYGVKVGLLVFVLDILKPIVSVMIAFSFKDQFYIPIIAIATVIGHIWPVFFKFKGGKGAACMLGFVIMLNWVVALIGVVIFVSVVFKTRMVSLGSTVVPFLLIIVYIALSFIPGERNSIIEPLTFRYHIWQNALMFGGIWVLVTIMHKDNIKRIIQGKENKLGTKKA